MANVVEGHLPGANKDVLETHRQRVTPGIHGVGSIIHRQLEGLQLLHQGYNREQGSSRRG
jgi:hypothetical protein